MASKLSRRLRLPAPVTAHAAPVPQSDRMALLGQLLAGHELPLRSRVAAVIVLLYAQRVSRIVRLTIDDVIRDGDQVLLRLGEPPSPVPAPFAQLLLIWIDERDNMNTATNPDSRWLFPGRRAGQPMHPESLAGLINKLGVPTRTGRTAAIRQHVLEMPAPVVADALSYHPVTTAKIATHAGASPGAATPPATTQELATVEYASSPVLDPQFAGQGFFQLGLGAQRGLGAAGRAHPLAHHRTQLLRKPILNISQFVKLMPTSA